MAKKIRFSLEMEQGRQVRSKIANEANKILTIYKEFLNNGKKN